MNFWPGFINLDVSSEKFEVRDIHAVQTFFVPKICVLEVIKTGIVYKVFYSAKTVSQQTMFITVEVHICSFPEHLLHVFCFRSNQYWHTKKCLAPLHYLTRTSQSTFSLSFSVPDFPYRLISCRYSPMFRGRTPLRRFEVTPFISVIFGLDFFVFVYWSPT